MSDIAPRSYLPREVVEVPVVSGIASTTSWWTIALVIALGILVAVAIIALLMWIFRKIPTESYKSYEPPYNEISTIRLVNDDRYLIGNNDNVIVSKPSQQTWSWQFQQGMRRGYVQLVTYGRKLWLASYSDGKVGLTKNNNDDTYFKAFVAPGTKKHNKIFILQDYYGRYLVLDSVGVISTSSNVNDAIQFYVNRQIGGLGSTTESPDPFGL